MRTTGDGTLDELLDGGLPVGDALLFVGEPGSGARRLAERVLGAGGPALYLTATDREVADATIRMLVPPADGESAHRGR